MKADWRWTILILLLPLDRLYVATTSSLEVFTQENFVADVFQQKSDFTATSNFVPPCEGLGGNVHNSSIVRWKARGRLLISANRTFSPALTVEAPWTDIGRNGGVRKGGHFWNKFQGEMGVSTNESWLQKTRFRPITWRCLLDPMFSRFGTIPACNRQTDTNLHTNDG